MKTNQLLEFREIVKAKSDPVNRKPDRETRKLLLYLFTGTKGGYTRLRIIMLLTERPFNTHQLSKELGLDYKAIQHHIRTLERDNIISRTGEKYGAVFRLSTFLEVNIEAFNEIILKITESTSR
jgi:predicted transcriptional regulator